MTNICANCKYHLLRKYSYSPDEHLCTHPQSEQIGLVSGRTYYQDCKDIREQFTMASKYGGSTNNCELYAEPVPEPTLSELIGDFFGSIGDFFKKIFTRTKINKL